MTGRTPELPRPALWRSVHLWVLPLLLLLVVFHTLAAPDDISPRHDEAIAWTSHALVSGEGYTACLRQYFPLCQPGDPTAAREPLPVLLFAAQEAAGLRLSTIQTALNLLTGLLLYALALRVFGDYRVGLLALLLWATYIPPLHTVNFYRAEPLLALLVMALLLALVESLGSPRWWRFVIAGVLLGMALLTRSALLYGTILILPGFYFAFDQRFRLALGRWALLMLAAAAVISPWVIRNTLVFDRPILGITLNGYNLLRHNYLIEGDDFLRYVSADEMLAHTGMLLDAAPPGAHPNEAEMDAFYMDKALRVIIAHPLRYAVLAGYRFALAQWFDAGVAEAYGYAGSPYQIYLLITNLILLPLAIWGTLHLPRDRWRVVWPLAGLFAYLSLIYPLVVTMFRYMVPVMPVTFMLAGYALTRLFHAGAPQPALRGLPLHGARAAAVLAVIALLAIAAGLLPLDELRAESRRWVTPLDGPDAEATLRLAMPDGTYPCGVFDVGAHGERLVRLEEYPACHPPDLTVRCLDGEAHWQENSVSEISVSLELRLIRFISAQHGTCGIFPLSQTGQEAPPIETENPPG